MLLNLESSLFKYHFPSDPHLFISENFMALNAYKTDKIVRLVQDTEKVQIGLIAGVRNAILMSPFSAPYGGFHFKSESNIYPGAIESFLNELQDYAHAESLAGIIITLPPDIYCQSSNAKVVNAFIRLGFKMAIPDITNWVDLSIFQNVYSHPASRTYYNQAVKKGLEFSTQSLAAINDEKKTLSGKIPYQTEEQYLRGLDRSYHSYADTYATLLYHNGDYAKAYEIEKKAVEALKRKDMEMNESYSLLVEKTKGTAAAQAELEKFF